MNTITHLRRISPLAIILVALAAVLAMTPAAHAQSTQSVQLHPLGLDASLSATRLPNGTVGFAPDNNTDFKQRWLRQKVNSSGVYRFSPAGFNSCIRVPAGLGSADSAPVIIGSCSGAAAQWRLVPVSGPGDYYVNVGTGHYMSAGFCFGNCVPGMDALSPSLLSIFEPYARWSTEILG